MATTVQELWKKRKEREAQAEAGASPSASSGMQNLLERRRAASAASVQQEIIDRTTKWLENSNTYIKNYQNRVGHRSDGVYVDDAGEAFDRYSDQLSRFDTEAAAIKQGLDTYGAYYDPEFVKQITDILDGSRKTQAEIIEHLRADRAYWSKWSGEEEYNKAYDNTIYGKKYDGASYAEVMSALWRTVGRERAWLEKNRDSYMSSEDAQAEIDRLKAEMDAENKDKSIWGHVQDFVGSFFSDAETGEDNETKKYHDRIATLEGIRDAAKRKEIVAQYDQYKQPAGEMAAKIQALLSQEQEQKQALAAYLPKGAEADKESYGLELPVSENVDDETYENNVKLLGFSSIEDFEAWKKNTEKPDDERFLDKVKNRFSQNRLAPYFDALQNPKIGSQFSMDVYTSSEANWKYLKKEEVQVYDYLLMEYGSEKADQYLSDMEVELDRRAAVEADEGLAKDIEEGGALTSLGYTALSVLTKPIGGIASILDNAVQSLEGALNGKPYNPYSEWQSGRRLTSGIRQNVSQKIDKAVEGTFLEGKTFGQNTMSFLYNTVMSGTDSLVGATVLGPLYTISMAGDASGEMAEKLYEQGASGSQIFTRSLAAGLAEYITEKVSVERLLDFKNPAFKGQIAIEILKQAGVEATEEMASDVLNLIADSVIMASQSDMAQAIQRYTEGYYDENGVYHPGVSKEEATQKAWGDFFTDMLADGLAGAISGGLGGTVSVGVQAGQNVKAGKKIIKAGRAAELIEKGQAAADGSQAKKIADRLAKQKEAGKALSPMAVGALKQTKLQDLADSVGKRQYASRAEIEQALADAEVENPIAMAESLDRAQRGEADADDRAIIEGNDKAARVLQRIQEENELRTLAKTAEAMTEMERIDSLTSPEFSRYDSEKKGATTLTESGESVVIEGVKAARDGELIFRLADGREVSSTDITFASGAEAELYAELARSEIQPGVMKNVVDHFNGETSAKAYVRGMETAYLYGWAGIPAGQLASLPQLASLNEAQRGFAYDLGRIRALDEDAKKTTRLKNLVEASRKTKNGKRGRVILEGVSSRHALTERQKASKGFCELAAKILGINIHLFESDVQDGVRGYTPKDGDRMTDNGFYDPQTGDIWLDINAGAEGRGLTVFTLAHELAHFIRQWSPEKFRILSDFLMETYGKKGVSVDELISAQQAYAKEQGRELTFREAWEEVVGDSMETLLNDGRVMERIAALKKRDGRLADKIMGYIRRFVDRVTAAYENEVPDSKEGKTVAGWAKEEIEALQDRLADALYDASETFQKTDVSRMETSEGVKNQARPSKKDPSQLDPRTVTKEDVQEMLTKAKNGDYYDNTYIPLRINTPSALIYWAKEKRHDIIDDHPIAMSAGKAYQAMAKRRLSDGSTPHKLSVDDMISIIGEMNNPQYIVYQGSNGRYVEVIHYRTEAGKKAFAVMEIGENKDAVYMNQYEGGLYNLLVTAYSPESGKLKELLNNPNNEVVFDKKKDESQRTSSSMVPSVLNDSPFFKDSIPQSDSTVNSQDTQNSKKYSTRRKVASDEKTDVSRMETSEGVKHDGQERTYNDFAASDYYQNSELYSYDFLTRQKDMEAVNLPETGALAGKNGRIDDEKVIENGKKNALVEGVEKNGKIYVANTYTGRSLRIDVQTIRHGLDGTYSRHLTNARIGSMIGSVVKNAIPVNGLKNTAEKAVGTYAMVSYCHDSMGRQFIAVITVEQYSDNVESFELYDVAHAVSGRQKKSSQVDTKSQGVNPIKAATISIADLLQIVKSTHQSILSDNVLARLGEKRNPKGSYTDKVLFSTRREGSSNRSLLVNALESAAQTDAERNRLSQYKKKVEELNAAEERLHELNRQIREISFGKGARDMERLKALRVEAEETANRINRLDRSLLNLEATAPLRRILDAAKKDAEKKGKALAEQRAREAEDHRDRAVMRDKIKKKVNELNRLLVKPTKEKHIPNWLQRPAVELLSAINSENDRAVRYYGQRAAELQESLREAKRKQEILDGKHQNTEAGSDTEIALQEQLTEVGETIKALQAELDGIHGKYYKASEKLKAMVDAYKSILGNDNPEIAEGYHPEIADKLDELASSVGDIPISAMTVQELDVVYQAITVLDTAIRNANKFFNQSRNETITATAEAVYTELRRFHRKLKATGTGGVDKVASMAKQFGVNNLKPYVAAKLIGSETLSALFEEMAESEMIWARDMDEAKAYYETVCEKTGADEWDMSQSMTLKLGGNEVTLSLGQVMSLYAYSRRRQAIKHLVDGGFVHGNEQEVKTPLGKKGKVSEKPNRLTERELATIGDKLTEEQREFVQRMQSYLSVTMAKKGNSVSEILYGIDLFGEEFYFPIKSKDSYLRDEKTDKEGKQRTKNLGMTKATVSHANSPVVLSDFMKVWSNHVNDMSLYHGVLGVEDFSRVWNTKFRRENGDTVSLKETVKAYCGQELFDYFEKLIDDANKGVRKQSGEAKLVELMANRMKKGATYASLSVVVQQRTSEARAYAYIPERFFEIMPRRILPKQHRKAWEEMKKHCPLAVIKEMGGYDMTGGSTEKWIAGSQKFTEKIDDIAGWLPAHADEVTWVRIWEAAKNMAASLRDSKTGKLLYEKGNDEMLRKAADIASECLRKTQVYDSVFTRSGLMRVQDGTAKAITVFMAEPTTTVSMLVDSALNLKRGGKVKTAGREISAKRMAAKSLYSAGISIVAASLAKAVIMAMRDDDEEKTYVEKYLYHASRDLVGSGNPLEMIPWVKDVVSIFQGYDVSRNDLQIISDIKRAVDALQSEEMSWDMKLLRVATPLSSIVGLPVGNVMKDLRGMYYTLFRTPSISETTGVGLKDALLGTENSNGELLYEAYLSGDAKAIERYSERFKDDDDAKTALRKVMRERDSRIRETALSRMGGDWELFEELMSEMKGEKIFDANLLISAVNSEENAVRSEQKKTASLTVSDKEVTVLALYYAVHVNEAFERGDTEDALHMIEEIVSAKMENGKTEKEARAEMKRGMTSYWKDLYVAGDKTRREEIINILVASGLYGTKSKVRETVGDWLKA